MKPTHFAIALIALIAHLVAASPTLNGAAKLVARQSPPPSSTSPTTTTTTSSTPSPTSTSTTTTTTTSASSVCSAVPTKEPGKMQHCGIGGTLTAPSVLFATQAPSLSACESQCQSDSSCQSFSYSQNSSDCQAFSAEIQDQGHRKKTPKGSDTKYYNIDCFTEACRLAIPATCSNQGLQYAIYPDTSGSDGGGGGATGYGNFDPTIYKKTKPTYHSTTNVLSGVYSPGYGNIMIFNDPNPVGGTYYVIDQRGYFYPVNTGNYTLNFGGEDDIALFWIGKYAYRGFTRSNANLIASNGAGTYTFPLTAGMYYPFRVIYANAEGPGDYVASLTDPSGNVLLDQTGSNNQFVQYGCDAGEAPKFAAYGREK